MAAPERGQPSRNSWCAPWTRIIQYGPPLVFTGREPSPAGHDQDRPHRGHGRADFPTSHAWDGLRERYGSPRLRPGSPPSGPVMNNHSPRYPNNLGPRRPGWTTATLVSDSFPRKRKPPPRVTLLVGLTHRRAECCVNLPAGDRVPPSGTPPGPYSAYTCPSPGATDRS